MSEIDPLIFELRAEVAAAQAAARKTSREMGQSFGRVERDIIRLENQMKRSSTVIAGQLRGLAGAFGAGFGAREIAGTIDSFTRLQNSLRVAGLEGAQLEQVQGKLLDLSSRYGVSIEGLAGLYSKASDAGRSFGASQDQILQLTAATSQALLITGTNATQASGAILGLSQALASGTVRAEEFNQINEGGLRPLLQAAAATERFGGDVTKLRQAVVDGKLSSQEFFNAIIAGSGQLETQASKATLTLSGAFEALSSRLTVYIGSAASAHGVTGALAEGMRLLADNLDVIIPALATVAAVMGTSLVVNAVAGSRAFFALTAAMGGAATAAEAATFAFGGLSAVLAGPAGVALAITAVGAGLYYLSTQADGTKEAIDALKNSNVGASDELERMIGRLKDAGVETDALAAAAARAKGPIDDLADAYSRAAAEARKLNAASGMADVEKQQGIIRESQDRQSSLRGSIASAEQNRRNVRARFGNVDGALDSKISGLRAELAEEIRRERLARTRIGVVTTASQAGVDVTNDKPARSAPSASGKSKSTRTPRSPADNTDRDAARAAQELASLQMEELRARAEMSTDIEERANLERQILAAERDQREADIDARVKAKTLSIAAAAEQKKILDILYGQRITEDDTGDIIVEKQKSLYGQAQQRQEQERLARQQTDAMRDELAALGAEAGVTDVRKARVEIERRMLEIQQDIERKLLDEAIARGDVADAAAARAALARKQAADTAGFDRDNKGPLGQYLDDIRKVGLNMNDEFEKVAVDGLQSLNDGLVDAIVNSKSLGDVFKNVAKQIIADLIRIAIQQTIVNSLMSALSFGGGGGGGIGSIGSGASGFGSALSIFGRASGGYVAPGQTVRVNEHAGGAEYLRMGSRGGTVIPLGQVNQPAVPANAGKSEVTTVRLELSGDIDARIDKRSAGVAVQVVRASAPAIIDGAVSETFRQANRPRMPGSRG